MRPRSVSRLTLAAPVVMALISIFVDSSWRGAQADEPKSGAANDKAEPGETPLRQGPVGPNVRTTEKVTALALWCGIVVVGLALLTAIMVWGRWLRRIARRKPLPPTAPDPLWYLKPKLPLPSAPAGAAPADSSRRSDDDTPGSDVANRTPL